MRQFQMDVPTESIQRRLATRTKNSGGSTNTMEIGNPKHRRSGMTNVSIVVGIVTQVMERDLDREIGVLQKILPVKIVRRQTFCGNDCM